MTARWLTPTMPPQRRRGHAARNTRLVRHQGGGAEDQYRKGTEMSDAVFARSAATDTLIEMLTMCPEGGTVTYEAMSRATNRDIQRRDRHLLSSAMRVVRNDAGAIFSAITRVGIQRLRPEEVMLSGKRRIKRIASAAKRGGREMDTVRPERLDASQRLAHAAIRGVLASIETASKPVPQPSSSVITSDPVVKLAG